MKKVIPFLFTWLSASKLFAQGESASNRDTFMVWDLKIYVVLAVLFIILSFLIIFLFSIESRLKGLEQNQKTNS